MTDGMHASSRHFVCWPNSMAETDGYIPMEQRLRWQHTKVGVQGGPPGCRNGEYVLTLRMATKCDEMSLGEAMKELDRLEAQMQSKSITSGGSDKKGKLWEEAKAKENGEGDHEPPGRGLQKATDPIRCCAGGVVVSGMGDETLFKLPCDEAYGVSSTIADEPAREESPTRVHLRRTGSVEIERGYKTSSWPITSSSRDKSSVGRRATSGLAHEKRLHGLDSRRSQESRRSTRDDPLRASVTDDGRHALDDRRVHPSVSKCGGRSSMSWQMEAEADLSEIKATMRRLDGYTKSNRGIKSTFSWDLDNAIESAASSAAGGRHKGHPTDVLGEEGGTHACQGFSGTRASGTDISVGEEAGRTLGWGTSSGSKAVLSALRSLQDKIRKLERERDRAAAEAATLRGQITALQSGKRRAAQVSSTGGQAKEVASRLAYEHLQADKAAVDGRLRKAEEQKRLLTAEIEASRERKEAAEEARRAADSRVAALEDRLAGLEKKDEDEKSAKSRAIEEAAKACQEKTDQVEALKAKVVQIEASLSAEKSLRDEAEDGLARALSAKRQLERFLEGILRVNEELVENAAGVSATARRTKPTGRVPRAARRARQASAKVAVAPAPCCAGTGGFEDSVTSVPPGNTLSCGRDFNVGTHTAKRAKTRVRKMKRKKKASTSSTVTLGSTNRLRAGAPQRSVSNTSAKGMEPVGRPRSSARVAPSSARTSPIGAGRAVPFLAPGRTAADSYHVASAVSKAVRTAKKGRSRESLRTLCADVAASVLESSSDVPFMFQERGRRFESRQRLARRTKAAASRDHGSHVEALKASPRGRRAAVDVEMPVYDRMPAGFIFLDPMSRRLFPLTHGATGLGRVRLSERPSERRRCLRGKPSQKQYWNPRWDEDSDGDHDSDDNDGGDDNGAEDGEDRRGFGAGARRATESDSRSARRLLKGSDAVVDEGEQDRGATRKGGKERKEGGSPCSDHHHEISGGEIAPRNRRIDPAGGKSDGGEERDANEDYLRDEGRRV